MKKQLIIKKIKRLLAVVIMAILVSLYYSATCREVAASKKNLPVNIIIFVIILLGVCGSGHAVGRFFVLPELKKRNYRKVYLTIGFYITMIVIGIILVLGFSAWRNKPLSAMWIMYVVSTSIFLVLLFIIQIQIVRYYCEQKSPSLKVGYTTLTTAAIFTALTVLCFIPFISDVIKDKHPYASYYGDMLENDTPDVSTIGEVTKGKTISQTLSGYYCGLFEIQLRTDDYNRENSGVIHIDLVDDTTEEHLRSWDLPAGAFSATEYIRLSLAEPLEGEYDEVKKLRLDIVADESTEENAVTFYCTNTDQYLAGSLVIDGVDTGKDLIMLLEGIYKPIDFEVTRIWLCLYLAIALEACGITIYKMICKGVKV